MGMFDSIFGGGDGYSDAFNNYANFMDQKAQRYNPWIDAGSRARDMNEAQYNRLINDPNAVQDQVAQGFSMSPYQKYMQDNVMKQMNYNAANTGMLGTGAANRALADDLTKMTGQFEDTYIDRGMNSYNRGLQGNEFLSDLGMKGLGAQDELYGQEAAAKLKGDMAQADSDTNMWGNILGTVGGAVAGGMMGGPAGASMGSSMGSQIFGGGKGGGMGGGGMGGGFDLSSIFGGMGGGGGNSFSPGLNAVWQPNNMGGYTQTFGRPGVGMPMPSTGLT